MRPLTLLVTLRTILLGVLTAASVVPACGGSPETTETASRNEPTLAAQAVDEVATRQAIAAAKVTDSLARDIRSGSRRDAIVVVNDASVRSHLRRHPLATTERTAFVSGAYRQIRQSVLNALPKGHIRLKREYSVLPYMHVSIDSATGLDALAENPAVVGIFENRADRPLLTHSLPLIRQPETAASDMRGAGASVVVIDTGVDYTHASFGSCSAPGVPSTCKVAYAEDMATNDNCADDNGHGTNVAGIVNGVAPGAKIIALDVFNAQGLAYAVDTLEAINWSIQHRAEYGIAAMNLSLGSGAYSNQCGNDVFAYAVSLARDSGILSAIASGNDSRADQVSSPSCVPAAVSVGAVYSKNFGGLVWGSGPTSCTDTSSAADQVTCFSNSASFLTILAPGALITAAGLTKGGTSMAAPHVAGAIAVLRAAHPNETLNQTVFRMTSTGKSITDARQSRATPRLDLFAASTLSLEAPSTGGGDAGSDAAPVVDSGSPSSNSDAGTGQPEPGGENDAGEPVHDEGGAGTPPPSPDASAEEPPSPEPHSNGSDDPKPAGENHEQSQAPKVRGCATSGHTPASSGKFAIALLAATALIARRRKGLRA